MQKYTVTRDVLVKQAVVVKATSASNAKELSRKLKFVEWKTLDRAKRTNYATSPTE